MFQVSSAAAEQIRSAAEAQDDDPTLRIAAKIEDDGQLVYGMGFDHERENDVVIQCEGVTLLISPHSHELLDEAVLEFIELRPGEFQFIFMNPKDGSCSDRSGPSACGSCGGGCK